MIEVDPDNSRGYTIALKDLLAEGLIDKDRLIRNLLGWMCEPDVEEFVKHYYDHLIVPVPFERDVG